MLRNKKAILIISFLAVPVIIYFYFLKWKTNTIYGDDLSMFQFLSSTKNISEIIDLSVGIGKYRPINAFSSHLIFELFHKNLNDYYLFNVFIQTINTYLVALLLNVFLRSLVLSLFFSLIYGLSRFSFFNFSQLFNGGALEGLAITFFVLSLFFIVRTLISTGKPATKKYNGLLLSILFANLSVYTHERYIVLFPFIILVIAFFPGIRALSKTQRVIIGLSSLFSIIINVVIKKYVYLMPFFVGTGNTNITFSFGKVSNYFIEAILNVFQINAGPDYLIGVSFLGLPHKDKIFIMLLTAAIFASFSIYLFSMPKAIKNFFALKVFNGGFLKHRQDVPYSSIFIFSLLLLILCLVPAIVTIRLEQRWLQAPFIVFILMLVIALTGIKYKNNSLRIVVFSSFFLLFIWANYNYLDKGVGNLYMKDAEMAAFDFEQAVNRGVISPATSKLYIWEKHNDANVDDGINWAIAEGYLFEFYQHKDKEVIFVDSLYKQKPDSSFEYALPNFNKKTDQVIFLDIINSPTCKFYTTDITSEYLKDSLKNLKFSKEVIK